MTPLSDEEENYIRLALLLKGVSPRAVRTFFDKEFPPTYLPSTLNKNLNTLKSLFKKRILNQAQWNHLFPTNGGGPCSNDISSISQKVCDILGEDSPTISGMEGGLDINEKDHISVSNENKGWYESLPDSEDEEDIPPVSKRQRISRGTTKTSSEVSNPSDPLTALHTEVLNLEKEKLNLQIETLKLEKEKLSMEKNKLALEINKLSFEMKTYGIDVEVLN